MINKNRLIDAKPLMENGWHLVKTGESNRFLAQMSLADVPTVEAVEVVHGRWDTIWYGTDRRGNVVKCSVCGYRKFDTTDNYCPNCGAKMDGGNKDG